jgi:putative FmdB family regulatory protein
MPIYEYQAREAAEGCARCRAVFEVRQSMSEEPLTRCPDCGRPVERIISLSAVSTAQSTRSMLSDKNLKEKGFHKLVNEGGGKFRKTV